MSRNREIIVSGIVLCNKSLTNIELREAAEKISIPNFRGVFVRDGLPKMVRQCECGIVNLDDSGGGGTHWVAYFKNEHGKYYFGSYGIQPPLEIMRYLKSPIYYNTERLHTDDQVFSGHLCLNVLKQLSLSEKFQTVMNSMF